MAGPQCLITNYHTRFKPRGLTLPSVESLHCPEWLLVLPKAQLTSLRFKRATSTGSAASPMRLMCWLHKSLMQRPPLLQRSAVLMSRLLGALQTIEGRLYLGIRSLFVQVTIHRSRTKLHPAMARVQALWQALVVLFLYQQSEQAPLSYLGVLASMLIL